MLEDFSRLRFAGYERHIRSVSLQRAFNRLLVALALGGHNDVGLWPNLQATQLEISLHSIYIGKAARIGMRRSNRDRVVDGLGELGESLRNRRATQNQDMRSRQDWFDVDVEHATTVANHVVCHEALLLR